MYGVFMYIVVRLCLELGNGWGIIVFESLWFLFIGFLVYVVFFELGVFFCVWDFREFRF